MLDEVTRWPPPDMLESTGALMLDEVNVVAR